MSTRMEGGFIITVRVEIVISRNQSSNNKSFLASNDIF